MGRPPCCDRSNVKRGLWTPEEDAKILAYVSTHGTGNWSLVPKKAGLNRCGKSCRLRWTNYLRPDLKHDTFTPQEEELIIKLHKAIGSRWSWIAKQLPGRTDNDVKNYWNTKLKKKLRSMGIDPITHKPISQILTDFGNISASNNIPNMSLTTNLTISKQEDDYSANFSDLATATISNLVTTNSMSEEQTIHENSSAFSAFFQPFFFNEATNSSCSSSNSSATFAQLSPQPQSYSCQQQQQQHQDQATVLPSSSSFMWSEFLLENPVSDAELNGLFMSSTCSSTLPQNNGVSYCKFTTGNGDQNFNRSIGHEGCGDHVSGNDQANYYGSGDPTCASSFVDGILDKDREMSSQFPEILDPSFD